MSDWIKDVVRVYKYTCPKGSVGRFKLPASAAKDFPFQGTMCGCGCESTYQEYAGFENVEASEGGVVTKQLKTEFEQNGRIGVKIGNTYISKTKMDFMDTGDTTSKVTSAFQEHTNKQMAEEAARYARNMQKSL